LNDWGASCFALEAKPPVLQFYFYFGGTGAIWLIGVGAQWFPSRVVN
jgi:hypothetical protein